MIKLLYISAMVIITKIVVQFFILRHVYESSSICYS